jgi:hypothetical protein
MKKRERIILQKVRCNHTLETPNYIKYGYYQEPEEMYIENENKIGNENFK